MHFLIRSGTLILGSVAASFFLTSCQTTEVEPPAELAPAPIVSEPEQVHSEVPTEEDIAKAEAASVRALEEELLEKAKSQARLNRSLESQAAKVGATVERIDDEKQWLLTKGNRTLLLTEESRIAYLDGIKVFLDVPLRKVRGHWLLDASDERILLGSVFGNAKGRQETIATVMIDPGHGGSQTGTKNEELGVLEKEMTLDVSLRLQSHLEEAGFKVLLTRYDDRLVGLAERTELANTAEADLFVSVHFNAAVNKKASGLETFMLTPEAYPSSSESAASDDDAIAHPGNRFDIENFMLAYSVQDSMLNQLGREDRGLKKSRFAVLKYLDCPGVLAECGFVSNSEEGLLISTAGYRERVAQALADAIFAYSKSVVNSES